MSSADLSTAAVQDLIPMTGIIVPGNLAHPGAASPAHAPGDQPDAEIAIDGTLVRVHAMFHVDPKTNRVQVSVVDDRGRLIRMIPPESVAQMLEAMAAYPSSPF